MFNKVGLAVIVAAVAANALAIPETTGDVMRREPALFNAVHNAEHDLHGLLGDIIKREPGKFGDDMRFLLAKLVTREPSDDIMEREIWDGHIQSKREVEVANDIMKRYSKGEAASDVFNAVMNGLSKGF